MVVTTREMTNLERRMLSTMLTNFDKIWSLEELLAECNWDDQIHVVGSGNGLSELGFVELIEEIMININLGPKGFIAKEGGLLEQKIILAIEKAGGKIAISEIESMANIEKNEVGIGIGLLKDLGINIKGGFLEINENERSFEEIISGRTDFISSIFEKSSVGINDLDKELVSHFKNRKGLIEFNESKKRYWKLTQSSKEITEEMLIESNEIVEITPELLQSDDWRNAKFKSYDVTLEAAIAEGGRSHPMQSLIERIRSIFLEMGFEEISGDYVQSVGWNMDALFIPQDHPAREMQDTFYLNNPSKIDIDSERTKQWKNVHENGGDTGSRGWGGTFSEEVAKSALLRTHTTVNTIKYLEENPKEPCRVFAIGRVFRKESIDRTHLPEFHQIEGIIMEEGANLPMLVTTLTTFYEKMGYPEVRVRPAYFPYTEPSLEIEVKWKGEWLELGGAGIFRPEVTEPLGCNSPVLAWGMGLERLAMLILGLDDIRQLYISDIEWLRNQPIL